MTLLILLPIFVSAFFFFRHKRKHNKDPFFRIVERSYSDGDIVYWVQRRIYFPYFFGYSRYVDAKYDGNGNWMKFRNKEDAIKILKTLRTNDAWKIKDVPVSITETID